MTERVDPEEVVAHSECGKFFAVPCESITSRVQRICARH